MEKTERKTKRNKPGHAPGKSGIACGKAVLKDLGIRLNPATARQAVVLSEIIGKPLSRRSHRR